MSQEFHNWIENDEHAYPWCTNANAEPYTVLKRRVFVSFCAAAAYSKVALTIIINYD